MTSYKKNFFLTENEQCHENHKGLGPNKQECYITLSWKGQTWTNTLAYWAHSKIKKKMECCKYDSRDLHYISFFGRICCHIIISQSVCHCHLAPHKSTICRQGWSLQEWRPLKDSILTVGSHPCKPMLDQGGRNGSDKHSSL